MINVTSGGMYNLRWNAANYNSDPALGKYDPLFAYANAKRAQVILTDLFARKLGRAGTGVVFNSMHPGWAQTPGLSKSMKSFAEDKKDDLRTDAQGADSIVWMVRGRGNAGGCVWWGQRARDGGIQRMKTGGNE